MPRSLFDPEDVPIDYSWMPESYYDDDVFPCSVPGSWACTILTSAKDTDPEVYARSLAATHELVHAARARQLPSVLEEGVASVFDYPAPEDDQIIVSRAELLDASEAGTWKNASSGYGLYQRAAHFISFLFAEYGQDRFIEFERHIGPLIPTEEAQLRPLSDWRAGFQTIYGLSFADAWAVYEEYPDCDSAQFKLPLSACATLETTPEATLTPIFGSVDLGATFMSEFQCSDAGVFGPYKMSSDHEDARFTIHTLAIEDSLGQSMTVQLTGEIAAGTRALLTNCGNCRDGAGVLLTRERPLDIVNLPSGNYVLILFQNIDEPGPVGIRLSY